LARGAVPAIAPFPSFAARQNARVRCINDRRDPAPTVKLRRSLPVLAGDPRTPGRSLAAAVHREDSMKFMLTFTIKPETKGRDAAITRFKKTGGQTPSGVKLVSRWTAADFSGGYVLLEGDDATAITHFALMWSDLLELRLVPVVEDAQLLDALGRAAT
jgi:Domain of unknown function (DUF3303)